METKDIQIVTVDGYTKTCLTAIAALLAVLIVGLWAEMPVTPERAYAQRFADSKAAEAVSEGRWGTSSAPQQAVVQTQQETNAKLDQLMDLLRSGQAKVQLVGEPKAAAGGPNAEGAGK